MLTRDEISALAEPDPEQTKFLQAAGPIPPPDWSDMAKLRAQRMERYQTTIASLGPAEPHCTESYQDIPLRDGYKTTIKVWKPSQPASSGSPLIVLFYGGGFVFGHCDQLTMYGRDLCRLFGATVVAPNYRLAPEHPFPQAPHDTFDALQWCAQHAGDLGADPSKGFVIGGISAGANLSAVLSVQYAESNIQPPLTGVWLAVPPIFGKKEHVPAKYRDTYFSLEQNSNAPVLNADAISNMMSRYKPDSNSALYSPTIKGEQILRKLPKHYFQVCGLDPLRDDGIVYEQMLKDLGVKTKSDMYRGLAHAAWTYFPELKRSQDARRDFAEGMAFILGMSKREDALAGDGWAAAPS